MSRALTELIMIGIFVVVGYILFTHVKSRNSARLSSVAADQKTDSEWQQVVRDYGRYIERNPISGVKIRDAACLPSPKQGIKQALIRELLLEADEERVARLKTMLLILADFQDGVGPKPLNPLGVDAITLKAALELGADIKAVAAKIATNPTRQRYERYQELVNKELASLEEMIAQATKARHSDL